MMKKLIFSIFLAIFGTCYAPEFKGSSAIIPRIDEETPRPTDYQYYTPTQENIRPDSFLIAPDPDAGKRIYESSTGSARLDKRIEHEEPDYQNRVFDSPAMSY